MSIKLVLLVVCGAPQRVSVVQLSNSSTVRVSWQSPPLDVPEELILEYRVRCVGNESQQMVNRSVDGDMMWVMLEGLIPESVYRVQVAAVTSAAVCVYSQPVFIFLKGAIDQSISVVNDESVSLSEQITGVVRQPAFIAGIGVSSWMILMGFSAWIYCRHRRRKELGHYTTSFAYTPAVALSRGDGVDLVNGRPCLLQSQVGNYPWLADSWPTSNLSRNGKESVNCCSGRLDSKDQYYNTSGFSNYQSHNGKYSPTSNDGAIYCTINPSDVHDLCSLYSQGPDPYTSTPALSKTDLYSMDQWSLHSSHSGAEYAKLQYPRGEHAKQMKQKSLTQTSSPTWSDVLSSHSAQHKEIRTPNKRQ
ncbi:hypothetical protein DNTS_018952, partial [Danionella cerebrum]